MCRDLRSAIRWVSVVLLLGMGVMPEARANPPTDEGSYAGQFASAELTLQLHRGDNGQYTGEIHFKGQVFPVRATAGNGSLQGTFDDHGNSYPFTASLDHGALSLATGGKMYQLQPLTPRSNPLERNGSGTLDVLDYTLHDPQPGIDCDVVHLKIPRGWGVRGQVQWNLSVMMPGKWLVCAANVNGAELWIRYPGQTFVWRDNFNLLGINFQPHAGDADPGLGEEIERPLATATDCIKQVILSRFRKDIAQAGLVSENEMTPDQAANFARAVAPEIVNSPLARQIRITSKAATIRLEYALNGRAVQEDIELLVLYLDFPSNVGVVHVWSIPYCTSFRAEKGRLDEEKDSIGKMIEASLHSDPRWDAKRDEVVKQATQAYGDKLRALAQAVESDIIARMNRNIFDTCQQSYHRRMELERQTFHGIDNAIAGQSDYVMPDGRTVQAPIAPLGQSAWRDGTGQVKFFNTGVNPNGAGPGIYEQMIEK